jgi:hypothetical protein
MFKKIVEYLKRDKRICLNENNFIDLGWQEYTAKKDILLYKQFMNEYEKLSRDEKLSIIMTSEIFSEQVYKSLFLFQNFFNNIDIANSLSKEKTSNTYKSTIAKFVSDLLNVREIVISECANSSINELLLQEHLYPESLNNMEQILSLTSVEKIKFIESNTMNLFDKDDVFYSNGSHIFDACFIRLFNKKRRLYAISLETPIDAFYFPVSGVIIKSAQCRFEIASRVRKLNHYFFGDYERFVDDWTLPYENITLSYLIRDKRPYHVIADELSGYFYMCDSLNKNLELSLLSRSTFFEHDLLIKSSKNILSDRLQETGRNVIFFSSYYRLQECEFSEKYTQWLINSACQIYNEEIENLAKNDSIKIWLGITGGEKRVWIEEKESLVKVIKYFQNKYKNVQFVFDGYTNSYDHNQNTQKYINEHLTILNEIVIQTGLSQSEFISVIGAQILKKIAIGSLCSFHISTGTPSTWISKICKIPGIAHGNYGMLKNIRMVTDSKSIIVVPKEKITEIGINTDAKNVSDRWDFVNYSILPETIIELFEQHLFFDKNQLIKSAKEAMNVENYDSALHLWDVILTNSGKNDRNHMTEKLKCLHKLSKKNEIEIYEEKLRKEFKSYRNLEHLIKSASFFGNPNVKVVKDVQDSYRIIDCNTKTIANIVFITFGTVSSRHDHIPFAYPFLINQGFRHIHVAQYKGTQYQNLSREAFYDDLSKIISDNDCVFTYGASLGGYAALYYAPVINAKAIAASPRLPLHPLNKVWENILWTKGSDYDEYPFKHIDLLKNERCDINPTVILDTEDRLDGHFYNEYISKVFLTCELFDLKGSGHASLRALMKNGTLKAFIIDQVNKYTLTRGKN